MSLNIKFYMYVLWLHWISFVTLAICILAWAQPHTREEGEEVLAAEGADGVVTNDDDDDDDGGYEGKGG